MLLEMYVRVKNRMAELDDQRGVTAAEYALLIALIAVIIGGVVGTLGTEIGNAIQDAIDEITGAGGTD